MSTNDAEATYQKILHLINSGSLLPGDKLPSVRKMADSCQCKLSKVFKAYYQLEAEGVITSRAKSGFFVTTPPLVTEEPFEHSNGFELTKVENKAIITQFFESTRYAKIAALGAAAPTPDFLPYKKLAKILAASNQKAPIDSLTYDFAPGCEHLRRQLSLASLDWGCHLSPQSFITTHGAMEAFNLALKSVAEPGDIIAIESPTYFGVLQSIQNLGLTALEIPTNPVTGLNIDSLEQAFEQHPITACLLIPSFSNPSGACMPQENRQRLYELLQERQVPLIENDVYGDLYFGSTRPKTIKSLDTEGLVLLCSSFTKSLAPGYRVGFITPGRYWKEVMHHRLYSSVATGMPNQLAVAQFMAQGHYKKHLVQYRQSLREQKERLRTLILEYFPGPLVVSDPAGGILLWVELPETFDSVRLHQEAAQQGILVAPGPVFSASKRYKNYLRFNFATLITPEIEQTLKVLGRLIQYQL